MSPLLVAAITGFVSGLLLSIPVGPINLTILNEGARRGFKWAALIGAGATAMEIVYCFIAFTGFSALLQTRYIKAAMEIFTLVFLTCLGVKFLLAKSAGERRLRLGKAADRFETRFQEKVHPHSAFMTGMVRVMGNVGVLVFWIFLANYFISHEWVTPNWSGKLACVGGAGLGIGLWFFGLSWGVSLGHGKFTEKTLLKMERISGASLLALALIHAFTLVWQVMHHKF